MASLRNSLESVELQDQFGVRTPFFLRQLFCLMDLFWAADSQHKTRRLQTQHSRQEIQKYRSVVEAKLGKLDLTEKAKVESRRSAG